MKSTEYLSRHAGLGLVAVITFFVAVWLALKSNEPMELAVRTVSIPVSVDERFRVDAFFLPNEPLLGFVEIPGGVFVMGSDPDLDDFAFENERWSSTQRQGHVELPVYYIGRYEVTLAQYRAFVTATHHATHKYVLEGPADQPIRNVTWTDAMAYARWLESALQRSDATPKAIKNLLTNDWHITLPSEAEWEKAARGTDGRLFPWGNVTNAAFANFNSAAPIAVGSRSCGSCAYGLADLSGNVWEFTRSPYRPYPFSESAADPRADALYVMRGGSYVEAAHSVRAATRGGVDPGARREFVGFRLALTRGPR